jgi:hypothetical protein
MADKSERPTIVTLCGSSRFSEAFRAANLRETLAERMVFSIGCDFKSDDALGLGPEDKTRLDQLHLAKIDASDEILVLNVGGYVGESTTREIFYAHDTGKRIRFLENEPEGKVPTHGSSGPRWACRRSLDTFYDAQVSGIADYPTSGAPVGADEGGATYGKRLPYVGWFWRSPDWGALRIHIGDSGEFVGVMMSNKWGYPGRSMTPEEAQRFRDGLDWAFTYYRNGQEGEFEAACVAIWNWMQELGDVGVWTKQISWGSATW